MIFFNIKYYFICFALITLSCDSKSYNKDKELIRNNFENYKKAVLNLKGTESSRFISKSSLKFYERIIKNALFMDSNDVQSLSVTEKLHTLHLRTSLDKKQVKSMNGKGYFAFMINTGFFDQDAYMSCYVDRILFKGDSSKISLLKNDKDSGIRLEYLFENNDWKLNIVSPTMIRASDLVLTKIAKKQGVSESNLIINSLEYHLNKKIEGSIWTPMLKIEMQKHNH